jgi:DNA-binding GntR family transcriptional regulator
VVKRQDEPDASDDGEIEEILAERFRVAILSGKLSPGTKLPEQLLADMFQVTRARLRTTFQRLAFEELVTLKRNRGAFIASPGIKESENVFEARRVVERATAEIVSRTILTPQLRELRARVGRQEAAWARGDIYRATSELGEFHLALCSLAHNTALTVALERLIRRSSLILGLYGVSHLVAAIPQHHRRLLDVIERGASLDAARAMERCLFALQDALDLRPRAVAAPVLERIFSTIG